MFVSVFQYNELIKKASEHVEVLQELVLDFDVETKKPLVSVDYDLVRKLKPHQVCFSSTYFLILSYCTLSVLDFVRSVLTKTGTQLISSNFAFKPSVLKKLLQFYF